MNYKKIILYTTITVSVIITLLVITPPILFFFAFSNWEHSKTYDKKDLTDNYDSHEKQITELVQYFRSIVPKNTYVDIEINKLSEIDIFHVVKNETNYGGWRIKKNSPEMKQVLNILGWDENQLKILKEKLDEVNCISIDNKKPVRLGFQRSKMSKFSYVLFDTPLSADPELLEKYNDRCIYIYYRDNVVLEYGSGAIGSICFPERFLAE